LERRVLIIQASPPLMVVCLEPRIKTASRPSFTMPRASGWSAVNLQLAACERAVCGGGWVGSEASEFTEERLIGEMVKCYTAWSAWNAIMDTGASDEEKSLYALFIAQRRLVKALIRAGGGAYPLEVVNKCQYIAYERMDASKAGGGGGGSKGGSKR